MLINRKKKLIFSSHSDQGDRRAANEDCLFAASGRFGKHTAGLFAVADGCGGMQHGQEASQAVINSVRNLWDYEIVPKACRFRYSRRSAQEKGALLEGVVYKSNQILLELGRKYNCTPASTVSILLIIDNYYWIIHVGDSRIYMLHDNSFTRLTEDQTMLADMLRNREISQEDAGMYNRSILSMSVGGREKIYPFSGHGCTCVNDSFLLCSDGLYACLTEETMKSALMDPDTRAAELRTLIPEGMASDNVTCIVVRSKRVGLGNE